MRWGVAALVVAGVHGAGGWMVLHWQRAEASMGAPPAAVLIDLAPVAVAPEAPPQEITPGPEMVEAQPEAEPERPPEPVEQEPPPPVEPEPVALPEPEIDLPEIPNLPDPMVALAPPPPPPERPKVVETKPPPPRKRVVERKRPVRPDKPRAERTSAPTPQRQAASRPAAPAPGASSAPSPSQTASWRGSLNAHLNRFKRFPGGASPGTVQVAFTIDRGGRVLAARLVRGSGEAALDEEALAMIRRASPVPAPPDGLGAGGSISLSVPVRFNR
jgi:protein TonB